MSQWVSRTWFPDLFENGIYAFQLLRYSLPFFFPLLLVEISVESYLWGKKCQEKNVKIIFKLAVLNSF